VAVAADTAIVLYEPQAPSPVRALSVSGGARAVAFSPSGHRLYVALQRGDIRVLDRLSGEALETIELPGSARELRMHFYGQWLLARPETGDSVWVVDLTTNQVAGTVPSRGTWGLRVFRLPARWTVVRTMPGFPSRGCRPVKSVRTSRRTPPQQTRLRPARRCTSR
jgi:DNA-binding beta-propeller fold protein YncE